MIDYEHVLGHVTAGLVFRDDVVVEADPIIGFMTRGGWTLERVREHCWQRGWKLLVVHERH